MERTDANGVIISARALTKNFGQTTVLHGIDFELLRGQILGMIGPSGSGKTTTTRLLAGIYRPTSGRVRVLGQRPAAFNRRTREKIGYMPQQFALYPELSVWENLNFAASIYGLGFPREARFNYLLDFVDLAEHKKKLARNLSGGMKRRLSLATTLVHNPELLFLDEPTGGIDPVLRRKFWDHFRELQRQGRTLFVTTQYVGEASYCDYVGVMVQGRLPLVETPDGLRRQAFGGEVVDLQTEERLLHRDRYRLHMLPFVQAEPRRIENQENTLRIVVNQASTAIPELLDWCNSEYITVNSIEEYFPPFDDVFVELVKKVSLPEWT